MDTLRCLYSTKEKRELKIPGAMNSVKVSGAMNSVTDLLITNTDNLYISVYKVNDCLSDLPESDEFFFVGDIGIHFDRRLLVGRRVWQSWNKLKTGPEYCRLRKRNG